MKRKSPVIEDVPVPKSIKIETDYWPEWAGLQRAKRILARFFEEDCPTQSVLFYGSEGSGKSLVAAALAEGWLCTQPIQPDDPRINDRAFQKTDEPLVRPGACGTCDSCISWKRKAHPDFLYIEPLPPSRIIRLNSISPTGKPSDDANPKPAIQSFFTTAPLRGRSKVVWIEDMDRMNTGAANAFLKTLEEPPPFARIILTSSRLGAIPLTLISRCVCVACELPNGDDLKEILGSMTDCERIFGLGSPETMKLIRNNVDPYQKLIQFSGELSQKRPFEALKAAEMFRGIAKEFEKTLPALKSGETTSGRSREAQAFSVNCLAQSFEGARPEAMKSIAEAHRRIEMNGSFSLITDALFAKILGAQSSS